MRHPLVMVRSPLRAAAGLAPEGLPGVRRLWHASLGYVFGPPPFRTDPDASDAGIFGPGSVSWRIVGEPAGIVGGLRALLVQLLHPHAMAGVADHSNFREDPLARLRRTSAYVTTTTFGTTDEVLRAARAVRRVHRSVHGIAPDGSPYRADDPHLIAWVSIAFTASMLATDAAYSPHPVDRSAADRFVAEQARAAALLDPRVDLADLAADAEAWDALRAGRLNLPMIAEGRLPGDVDELDTSLATYRTELVVHAHGREALRFLLWPHIPAAVKTAYLPLLGGAVATLSPHERRLLGLPAARPAMWPVAMNTRALLAGIRLVAGTSPAQRAAEARVTTAAPPRGHRSNRRGRSA
jgi:uncharacterized protein (DUF2236 family)